MEGKIDWENSNWNLSSLIPAIIKSQVRPCRSRKVLALQAVLLLPLQRQESR